MYDTPNLFAEQEKALAGQIKPAYFLYGNDLYLSEESIRMLSEAFQKTAGKVERSRYYGGENNDDSFINSLVNVGMFAPRQIVIYKEITQLHPSHRKALLHYIENPDPNTLLIMTAIGQSRSRIIDDLKKKATLISVWTPPVKSFAAIITQYLQNRSFQISTEALDLLVYSTSDGLAHTFSELEKVTVYVGDRKTIEAEDIRAVVGGAKSYQISDFIDAVIQHDIFEALKICLALIQTGVNAPYFVLSLFHFFQNVWAYPKVHQPSTPVRPLDKREKARFREGYEHYRDSDFKFIFERLTDVDLKSKSVNLSTEELMIPVIYEIMNA